MSEYKIKLVTKDKTLFYKYAKTFEYNTKIQYLQLFSKLKKQKTKKKIVTTLKSPHVYKKAQEQFEIKKYANSITYNSWETKKYLVLLKKIKNQWFSGMKVKVNVSFSFLGGSSFKTPQTTGTSYYNMKYKVLYKKYRSMPSISYKQILKKTLLHLKILDAYGKTKSFR